MAAGAFFAHFSNWHQLDVIISIKGASLPSFPPGNNTSYWYAISLVSLLLEYEEYLTDGKNDSLAMQLHPIY